MRERSPARGGGGADSGIERVTQAARLLTAGRAAEAEQLAESLKGTSLPAQQRGRLLKILGFARYQLGKLEPACETLDRAERALPDDDSIPAARAQCHSQLGENTRALEILTTANWRLPSSAVIAGTLADQLSRLGKFDEANKVIERARGAGTWDRSLALAEVPLLIRAGDAAAGLARLDDLERDDPAMHGAAPVEFLRGECLDKLGQHEDAFDAWMRANAALGARFDPARMRARIEGSIRAWPIDRVQGIASASAQKSAPVFVIGMPRSGTTLLEQALGRHPRLHPCGELLGGQHAEAAFGDALGTYGSAAQASAVLRAAQAYARTLPRGLGRQRPVDKLPFNLLRAPFLAAIFPNARFVRLVRDPRDVAVSLFARNFQALHPYSTRLEWIADTLAIVERAGVHAERVLGAEGTGQLCSVRYEDLVEHPERELQRVLESVGEPWDEACLAPGAGGGATLRVDQIGRGIFKGSAGRWRRYESRLGELNERLRVHGLIE